MSATETIPDLYLHRILAVLDDLEQYYGDLYEETGDIGYLLLRFDTTALYHEYDAMRFPDGCTQR